jgi:SAM-dependent methyltransferase
MTTPFDYDSDPERFRLAAGVTQQHLTGARSLYAHLAEVLAGVHTRRILDIGCREGALRAALPAQLRWRIIGLDASGTMLCAHAPPVVQADAAAVPFRADVFDAAVAVNVLDHLAEPTVAISEARRGLTAGGIFIAATASRHDSPELAHVWRPPPSSFDAEDAPGAGGVRIRAGARQPVGCAARAAAPPRCGPPLSDRPVRGPRTRHRRRCTG